MSYTALEDTPIVIDLLVACQDNGWSEDGNIARHESCNTGFITLKTFPLVISHIYQVSYSVISVGGGTAPVLLLAGDTGGTIRTTPGLYVETITASGFNPQMRFYSDGNCEIQLFNVADTIVNNDLKQMNTICYAAVNNKWSDFRTFNPDIGFSLFIDTYTLYLGNLYKHENGSDNRNNFYGVQYESILRFVDNTSPSVPKTFLSLSIQSNELLITTTDGITTSLGQVSELSEVDFIKDYLADNTSQVDVFSKEGVYSASFLRDKNVDLLQGDTLKGNYMIIEIITTNNLTLNFFTVNVISQRSAIGSR